MNNNNRTVRLAESRDIPGILELLLQVNKVHHDGRPDLFKGNVTKHTSSELEAIITDSNTPVFICADSDNRVLGYIFCIKRQYTDDRMMTDIKTLYIDDVCVDSAHRGMHVGSMMFDHVKKYAEKLGCYNICLNVWSFNERATNFYRSLGMKPQKTIMELKLGEDSRK